MQRNNFEGPPFKICYYQQCNIKVVIQNSLKMLQKSVEQPQKAGNRQVHVESKRNIQQQENAGSEDIIAKIKKRYEKYPQPGEQRNRVMGIIFIVLQIIFIIAYGISGRYFRETPSQFKFYDVISVVLQAFFAIVGFGLVLSVYRWANWSGLATSIVVFAVSSQIGPLFQLMWQSAFINSSFESNRAYVYQNSSNIISQFFRHSFLGIDMKIQLSSYMYRTTLLSCVSILTFMTAVIGRISMTQILKITIIYQFFWTLNFYILLKLCVIRSSTITEITLPVLFDTYGSSYCYLFAVFFGITFSILANRHVLPTDHVRNVLGGFSWLMSAVGTAFIFATFVFGYTNVLSYQSRGKNIQRLSMFFGLCASVVGTYCGSAFSNKGMIGYKDALIGTIVGGVAVGSAAPIVSNPGIAIVIGSGSGFLSGLLNSRISSIINRNFMYDVLGLFVPFLISSLIGSLVVPSAHLAYLNNINESTYVLIYAGISAGLGLGGGLITGLACRWDQDGFGTASNLKLFDSDLGLYTPQSVEEKAEQNNASNEVLNRSNQE